MAAAPPALPQPPAPAPLYSSAAGEVSLRLLYDGTLHRLPFNHQERLVPTASFGHVHVTTCGLSDAPPLLLWHGATTPAPFMIASPSMRPLLERFRVYAPDLPCHAGSRSQAVALDPAAHDHGRWCLEVVQALGLLPEGQAGPSPATPADAAGSARSRAAGSGGGGRGLAQLPPVHVGVSVGAAMLLDLAVVAPQAIGAAVLISPGGLPPAGMPMPLRLALVLALYRLLPCGWTQRLMLSLLFDEPDLASPLVQQVLLGIRHVRYYPPAPTAFTDAQLRGITAPVFVAAAERDVWGPGRATVERARSVWPGSQCEALLLEGGRHIPSEARLAQVVQRLVPFLEQRGLGQACCVVGD